MSPSGVGADVFAEDDAASPLAVRGEDGAPGIARARRLRRHGRGKFSSHHPTSRLVGSLVIAAKILGRNGTSFLPHDELGRISVGHLDSRAAR
jgi:hypothetical protein